MRHSRPTRLVLSVILLGTLTSFFSCVRFRVDELSENLLFEVPIGKGEQAVNISDRNGFYINLPDRLYNHNDMVMVPNIVKRRVKIFHDDGRLETILGHDLKQEKKSWKIVNFPLNQPVRTIAGEGGSYYVQNRSSSASDEQSATTAQSEGLDAPPPLSSYLLHFSEKGELKATIGLRGLSSAPFGYIRRLNFDEKEQIVVLHSFGLELVLSYFNSKGGLVHEITESRLPVIQPDDDGYKPDIENLIPYANGEDFLISVSYRDKSSNSGIRYRLKYRRIYKCQVTNPDSCSMMLEISDPRESLFWTIPGGGFYIWQSEDSVRSVRLQVYDSEGTHINNKLITLSGSRSDWRGIYADLQGSIYSINTADNHLRLYSWE
jgi:hypothetical protein